MFIVLSNYGIFTNISFLWEQAIILPSEDGGISFRSEFSTAVIAFALIGSV